MAEKKTTPKKTEEVVEEVVNDIPEGYVPIFLPRIPDPNASQVEFWSLNFNNFLIERGKTVYIPKELYDLIEAQKKAEDEAIDFANSIGVRE